MIRRSLSTQLVLLALVSSAVAQVPAGPGDWPQWRGPARDGISTDKGLLKEWPENGPAMIWQVDTVGTGYSSLAVRDGRVITQGDLNGVEHVICLSVKDGKTLWAVQPQPVADALKERVAQEYVRMDADQDGVVSEAEALARLGWNFNKADRAAKGDAEQIADARAAKLMATFDQDSSGKLTYEEARSFGNEFSNVDSRDPAASPEALATARAKDFLTALDKDKDGVISRDEARQTTLDRQFGRFDARDQDDPKRPGQKIGDNLLTVAEIEAGLLKHENGKDGVITFDELKKYFTQRFPGQDGELTADELTGYYGGYRNGQGDGPRGTPTIDADRVYVEGGNGDVTCLDAATGETVWHVNLSSDLGGGRPGWGYCESPLIDGNHVIVTPGGKNGTMAALDKYTGKVVWRSGDTTQGAHYSSPIIAEICGVRQVVQFARSSVFGVTADAGRLMWEYSAANNGTANCCTPIVFNNHVLASSSYGTGGGLAKIEATGDGQAATEVYFEKKLGNHHGGIVKVGDYIYSLGSGTLICMNYLTGKIEWQNRSVGKGSLVVADGMLYLLSERYTVGLAEATPEKYRERGRFQIESHGRPSWAHPVVTGGRLYIRNQHSLAVYDVRGDS